MTDRWPGTGTLLASRYRLVNLLETGGMAEIWRARDELLGRLVALKLPTSDTFVWKEARAAARLSHPNVAAVHDYSEATRPDGLVAPFVVMELLSGESLAARLARSPVMTWQEATRVGVAVADALAAAHESGVVHRDIKPGNVMLTPTVVKLLDFGISAATGEPDNDETGATFGTPAYVSPERLDGRPAEPATDVYGLGVLLFEMVTGDPPYPVDTWEELAAARSAGPNQLPSWLPATFRDLVGRCLHDDVARRPTAAEARDALAALEPAEEQRAAKERAVPAPPRFTAGRVPPPTVAMESHRGRRHLVLATVVAVLVIIGVTAAVLESFNRTQEEVPVAGPSPASVSPSHSASASVSASASLFAAPLVTFEPLPIAPTPSMPAVLDFNVAIGRLQTALADGTAAGQIRQDVATDLLNLIRSLSRADRSNAARLVNDLRAKIGRRAGEGTIAQALASVLRSRLDDLDRAART